MSICGFGLCSSSVFPGVCYINDVAPGFQTFCPHTNNNWCVVCCCNNTLVAVIFKISVLVCAGVGVH